MSFNRPPPRPAKQWDGATMPTPRATVQSNRATSRYVEPIGKFTYVRSKALLAACGTLNCQHCGQVNTGEAHGKIDAAHSNQARHGKGGAIKASDVYIAALCRACHTAIDSGSVLSYARRSDIWDRAHRRTITALVMNELWPKGVAVPSIV